MEKTVCAACGETGGRFVFRGEKWYHARCAEPVKVHHVSSVFPFTTTNLQDPNDGPVTVQNLRHLRQLENRHGVASEPFNNSMSYQGERY